MNISEAGKAFIKRWESCKLRPYQDIVGVWTVGWGHALKPEEPRRIITQYEADLLFDTDIAYYVDAVNASITIELNEWQHAACCSLCYNIGVAGFRNSTVAAYLNAQMLESACISFLTYRNAGGKPIEGLLNRRAHEVLVFARGEFE